MQGDGCPRGVREGVVSSSTPKKTGLQNGGDVGQVSVDGKGAPKRRRASVEMGGDRIGSPHRGKLVGVAPTLCTAKSERETTKRDEENSRLLYCAASPFPEEGWMGDLGAETDGAGGVGKDSVCVCVVGQESVPPQTAEGVKCIHVCVWRERGGGGGEEREREGAHGTSSKVSLKLENCSKLPPNCQRKNEQHHLRHLVCGTGSEVTCSCTLPAWVGGPSVLGFWSPQPTPSFRGRVVESMVLCFVEC
jgi:hypothetical protein